jgi:hypothetical protein
MPVMPTMGKTTTRMASEGNGEYEAISTLSMAGSWQVTVTAKKDGVTLGKKTFNLVAKE